MLVEYSVLRYCPSAISGESINLGVVLFCPENNSATFEHIASSAYSRLHSFDDELDINIVKNVLSLIKEDIDDVNKLFYNDIQKFDLKQYIRYFKNEFHFANLITMEYNSFDEAVEEIKNIHLRLYLPKLNRPCKVDPNNFIEKIIKNNNIKYSKNKVKADNYNLNVKYDFLLNNNSTGIKLFNINKDNIKNIDNSLKAWAWNQNNTDLHNIIIIYNINPDLKIEDKKLKNIINFLTKTISHVINGENIDSLVPLIAKLN